MDRLVIQAEYSREVAAQAAGDETVLPRLRRAMEERLRTVIGVWPTVQLQPPDALPRSEFKARRVIDNRDLFHSLRGGG